MLVANYAINNSRLETKEGNGTRNTVRCIISHVECYFDPISFLELMCTHHIHCVNMSWLIGYISGNKQADTVDL